MRLLMSESTRSGGVGDESRKNMGEVEIVIIHV